MYHTFFFRILTAPSLGANENQKQNQEDQLDLEDKMTSTALFRQLSAGLKFDTKRFKAESTKFGLVGNHVCS